MAVFRSKKIANLFCLRVKGFKLVDMQILSALGKFKKVLMGFPSEITTQTIIKRQWR